MSFILQAQQLYTAGIPLSEAYLLPMANNRTRNERLSAATHVVQIYTHAGFPLKDRPRGVIFFMTRNVAASDHVCYTTEVAALENTSVLTR